MVAEFEQRNSTSATEVEARSGAEAAANMILLLPERAEDGSPVFSDGEDVVTSVEGVDAVRGEDSLGNGRVWVTKECVALAAAFAARRAAHPRSAPQEADLAVVRG